MQIFVEIERARLTKQLAKLKEEEGKVDEAAEILQEVAVVSHARLISEPAMLSSSAGYPWWRETLKNEVWKHCKQSQARPFSL